MKKAYCVIFFAGALFLVSCATIPPESVELSNLIGDMVISSKVSHINMVNRHFNYMRTEVDHFALNDYKEAYLENVRKKYKEKDPNFVELSFDEYDRVISRVLKKRTEWLEEVEKKRQKVLEGIEEHYALLLASNAEVTSLLKSAAKVSETRTALIDRYGKKVGITSTKMKEVEDQLSEGTSSIRSLMDTALKAIGG